MTYLSLLVCLGASVARCSKLAYGSLGFGIGQCWAAQAVCCVFIALGVVAGIIAEYVFGLPVAVHWACNLVGVLTGSLILRSVLVEQLRPHFRDYIAEKKIHV